MPLLRKIPLKYRLPLVHAVLWGMARFKARRWQQHDSRCGPLVVTGFLSESTGIGQAGRLSLDSLRRAGFDPVSHDIAPCYRHSLKSDGRFPVEQDGGVWFIHANAQECLIAMMAFPPETWRRRYRIGFWAWETTQAAPLWAWAAQFLHEIWVPSRFVQEAVDACFDAAGTPELRQRVRVMPHPIAELSSVRADRPAFELDPSGFEALCLFDTRSAAARKNPWAVIESWTRAFPRPVDRQNLRLKVQNVDEDEASRERLQAVLAARPDISLIDRRFEGEAMMRFIASFDVLISLHRAEGFGLTLAEAMAMGVTPVATGWSGNLDFMDEANSYLVPADLIAVHDPAGLYGKPFGRSDPAQRWAEPRIDAATDILRMLVHDDQRIVKLARARDTVRHLADAWSSNALRAMPFAACLTPSPAATMGAAA